MLPLWKMTLNATIQGPEARMPNVSPARKGWGEEQQQNPSAGGAAPNQPSLNQRSRAHRQSLHFESKLDACIEHRIHRDGPFAPTKHRIIATIQSRRPERQT